MTHDIYYADATELAQRIRTKSLSPVEVVRAHQDRIEAVNPTINAVVTLNERAMERAREAESAIMRGTSWGPLHGVPFTAKEVFDTEGVRSTRGSTVFADHVPNADATAVKRLKEAGGILIGKTNCPEFALWSETSNRLFGQTKNPWDVDRTPGGSSGGEAAAISAGLSPLGIGTDLGGSNRLPSHYCGIVGFKPTHGRIPLTGAWPELMSRHMHVGPIARTVRDVALALSVLSGHDGVDPYSLAVSPPDVPNFGDPIPPLRVGWFAEGPFAPVAREVQEVVRNAVDALEALGCTSEPVSFDWEDRMPIRVALDLLVVEARHYFPPFVAGREDELTRSVKGLLESPMPTLSEYVEALDKRESIARDVTRFFADYDLLVCPTAPVAAHEHDQDKLTIEGQEVGSAHVASITATFGLTGSPAISIPFGRSPSTRSARADSKALPIGVQLAAGHLKDETLLRAAYALEATVDDARIRPPI